MIEKNFVERHRNEREALRSLSNELENYNKSKVSDRKIDTLNAPENSERALTYFWSHKQELYDCAFEMYRKVIKEGLSYRNYGVGSAALVMDEDGNFEIIQGYNEKADAETPKHCGEMKIVQEARRMGYSKIIGIVVVAENQYDPSGLQCTTLHPCRECRNLLSPTSGISTNNDRPGNELTWGNMPVVTFSIPPDDNSEKVSEHSLIEEINPLSDLIREHDEHYHEQGRNPEKDNFEKNPYK